MNERIRILHVLSSELSLAPFLREQLRHMAAQSMEVGVASPPSAASEKFVAAEQGRFFPCPMSRPIDPWNDLKSITRLSRHIVRWRPHVVHAHGPKAGLVGMTAAILARAPVRIYHVHGLPFLSDTQPQLLLRAATRVTCALANQVLSVSKSNARALVDSGCCPAGKVKTLLAGSINGIDARERLNPKNVSVDARQLLRQELGIPANAFVCGFVGRIVLDKGITELLTAWNQLRELHPHSHLLMVGPLEERNAIPHNLRAQLVADPRIHSLGWVDEVSRVYAAMDLVVLPSYREGLGLALLEAGAMGLPTIASDIPGCIDAVQDGVTGTLLPPRNAAALSAAISRYIVDADLRAGHGASARQWVLQNFNQEAIWSATIAEYHRLVDRHGIRSQRQGAHLEAQAA